MHSVFCFLFCKPQGDKKMRLKTLFFPIVLVISLLIGFVYIWPEVIKIRTIMAENITKKAQLVDIKSKSELIGSIGEKVSSGESVKIVKEYLPEIKIEERIIKNINYLASDANVFLLDISLSDAVKNTSAELATPVEIDPVTGLPLAAIQAGIQSTTAQINIAGTYQQVRIFLDGIQRLPIFNAIDSVSIQKKEAEKTTEGTEISNQDSLLVDLSVNFGFMPVSKITGVTASTFNSNIDESSVNTLKGYFSNKNRIASTDFSGEKNVRENPFMVK